MKNSEMSWPSLGQMKTTQHLLGLPYWHWLKPFLFVLLALCRQSVSGQTVIGFDTSDELLQNFTEAGVTPGIQYVWDSRVGVGGVSGVLTRPQDFLETLHFNIPVSPANHSQAIGFSTSFLLGPSGRPQTTLHRIGFTGSPADGLYDIGSFAYLDIEVRWDTVGAQPFNLVMRSKAPSDSASAVSLSPVFSASSGWYRLDGTWQIRPDGTNIWMRGALFSLGVNGTDLPAVVSSFESVLPNPYLAGLPVWWAGVDFKTLDNFVVPEPSVLALLALGGGLFLWQRRRRP